MKLEVVIEKKHAFAILAGIFLLAVTMVVIAQVPNPGHSAQDVSFEDPIEQPVTIDSTLTIDESTGGSHSIVFQGSSGGHGLRWEEDASPQFRFSGGLEVHGNLCFGDNGIQCVNQWGDLDVDYYDCVNKEIGAGGGWLCGNSRVPADINSNGGDWGSGDFVKCCRTRIVS